MCISVITLFELYAGATNDAKWNDVIRLTEDLSILPFTKRISELSAKISLDLRKRNKIIEFRDIFIAATAIDKNIPLKTLNTKHFNRIRNLELFS